MVLGLIGAALFLGDSMITPALSVLSAVECLKLVAPSMAEFILPISIAILVGLFCRAVPWHGGRRTVFFGPLRPFGSW